MGEAVGAANGGAMVPRGLAVGEAVVQSNCVDDSMQPQIDVGHLSASQVTIFRQWMDCGYDVPVADAAAIKGMSVQDFQAELVAANVDRQELEWQQILATALGVGDWAADWAQRHHKAQIANDKALAQALQHNHIHKSDQESAPSSNLPYQQRKKHKGRWKQRKWPASTRWVDGEFT